MKTAPAMKCPKCDNGLLKSRAKRGFVIKYLLFWLPFKRYKCSICDKKTYKFGSYARRRKKVSWS